MKVKENSLTNGKNPNQKEVHENLKLDVRVESTLGRTRNGEGRIRGEERKTLTKMVDKFDSRGLDTTITLIVSRCF